MRLAMQSCKARCSKLGNSAARLSAIVPSILYQQCIPQYQPSFRPHPLLSTMRMRLLASEPRKPIYSTESSKPISHAGSLHLFSLISSPLAVHHVDALAGLAPADARLLRSQEGTHQDGKAYRLPRGELREQRRRLHPHASDNPHACMLSQWAWRMLAWHRVQQHDLCARPESRTPKRRPQCTSHYPTTATHPPAACSAQSAPPHPLHWSRRHRRRRGPRTEGSSGTCRVGVGARVD